MTRMVFDTKSVIWNQSNWESNYRSILLIKIRCFHLWQFPLKRLVWLILFFSLSFFLSFSFSFFLFLSLSLFSLDFLPKTFFNTYTCISPREPFSLISGLMTFACIVCWKPIPQKTTIYCIFEIIYWQNVSPFQTDRQIGFVIVLHFYCFLFGFFGFWIKKKKGNY